MDIEELKSRLVLERKDEPDRTGRAGPIMFTPPIGEDYWTYRVVVGEGQAVLGFGKFGTIGVGFAVEKDWNANLPCRTQTLEQIWKHIRRNKGDKSIPDALCIEAIRLIKEAAIRDHGWESMKGTVL